MKFLEELDKAVKQHERELESLRNLLERASDRNDVHNQGRYAQMISTTAARLGALKVLKERLMAKGKSK